MSGPKSIPTPPDLQTDGVVGETMYSSKNGVFGRNDSDAPAQEPGGNGVFGLTVSPGGNGVFGANNHPTKGRGVQGNGPEAGVGGWSEAGSGVLAQTSTGMALHAQGGTGLAGVFDGNVQINGTLTATVDMVLGADCAEEFDITATGEIEPGTVMVLDEGGALRPSQQAYDKKVAGVISGAGDYRPGLILDKQQARPDRKPVALLGKVYCKVDAQYACIEVGDLLTTSPTPGHAMKADDPFKAFGAVIGKALRPLQAGQGTIPILIALQ